MEKDVNELAYNLHEAIENDERVEQLKKAEKVMESDETVMRLSYAFDVAQTQYNDVLKIHSENSKEAGIAQKKLYESKKALDENPLVKKYMQAYSEVRNIYGQVQEMIFAPFNLHECGGKE
ncbi:MAG: YlbF family regulator, partial [Firmicutes bacterium]|nr:YlbF family regulator [Bacillota bacterium]